MLEHGWKFKIKVSYDYFQSRVPAENDTEPWLIVRYETEVVVTNIYIYENWGRGLFIFLFLQFIYLTGYTRKIEFLIPGKDESLESSWELVWEGSEIERVDKDTGLEGDIFFLHPILNEL